MAELSDAEQQAVFKRWAAVLACSHQWEPTPDGEERCTRCTQRRVPSIEQTPGLIVLTVPVVQLVPGAQGMKVWVKRDEYPACTCEPCKRAMATSPQKGAMVVIHSEECECACEKATIDLWTFLLPAEH
jgi:hypothetical protein